MSVKDMYPDDLEEVIGRLDIIRCEFDDPFGRDYQQHNDITLAIEALEAFLPKKVILEVCPSMRKFIACPGCNKFLGYQYAMEGKPQPDHCPDCAQALDWDVSFIIGG